jgi:ATP-dependent RNA circularization protein (DNA/RNA ligase family)
VQHDKGEIIRMFRKYEKTYRIIKDSSRYSLSDSEVKTLLAGKVVVEEKLDGANVGIIRHKRGFHLQKRGSLVGQSEHSQFQYFHHWAHQLKYENIMSMPVGTIVYGELLYAVHTIYYDNLPDYVIMFDVWNGKKYLDENKKYTFIDDHGFEHAPIVAYDYFTREDLNCLMPVASAYGEIAEGIVVKRYSRKGEYFRGKVVKPQFIKEMEESDHWTHKQIRRNKLCTIALERGKIRS